MPADLALKLLGDPRQGPWRNALGRVVGAWLRITGRAHYDRLRLEHVRGTPLVILPSVFNPRVLRTGAFFADTIATRRLGERGDVLDLGTGSGICAVFAARHARRVVAVDINRMAVSCAKVNGTLNGVDVDARHGDLFSAVAGERFDAIFFNPPFIVGTPVDERDCAWRGLDVAARFAAGLDSHLAPGGRAYLLLSTFGDACARFVEELAARDYELAILATRRFINERVTILETRRRGGA
jgi:HemK-related putative methylase